MSAPISCEIVVVPPAHKRAVVERLRTEIGSYLRRSFPGFEFSMTPIGPAADDGGFAIFPVLGSVGDGESALLRPPPTAVLIDIKAALDGYDLAVGCTQ